MRWLVVEETWREAVRRRRSRGGGGGGRCWGPAGDARRAAHTHRPKVPACAARDVDLQQRNATFVPSDTDARFACVIRFLFTRMENARRFFTRLRQFRSLCRGYFCCLFALVSDCSHPLFLRSLCVFSASVSRLLFADESDMCWTTYGVRKVEV